MRHHPAPTMRLSGATVRGVERDPVAAVANANRPAADFARAEIGPLQAAKRITLFARQILHVPFRHFEEPLGHISHAPLGLDALGCLSHFAESQAFAGSMLFPVAWHGCYNNLFSGKLRAVIAAQTNP